MEDNKYLKESVNPIIEPLIVDLLRDRPSDILEYTRSWVDNKIASRSKPEEEDYEVESEEDEEDVVDELPANLLKAKQRGTKIYRVSVSAEAFGKYNPVKEFVPNVVDKTDEQKLKIKNRLSAIFMFQSLDEKSFQVVVNTMAIVNVKKGDFVIKQGDTGDHLYVVDSGALDCYKLFPEEKEPKLVKNYGPGEVFGELALLYNAPRAASVQAAEDCSLFSLDRETFNAIVKESAVKRRERYDKFLTNVEVLSTIDSYERSQLADLIKPVTVKAGEVIIKEGTRGDMMYFIEEGEAEATKIIRAEDGPQKVFHYKAGDYFGELALLKDVARQANVIALTDMSLAALDRATFKRLLGPLSTLLKRDYPKFERYSVHLDKTK
jgi:cAMP-dependent protein kinase regulator